MEWSKREIAYLESLKPIPLYVAVKEMEYFNGIDFFVLSVWIFLFPIIISSVSPYALGLYAMIMIFNAAIGQVPWNLL